MRITLAAIGARPASGDEFDALTRVYIQRIHPYYPCEATVARSEEAFLEWLERQQGRMPAFAVLLDSRGKQMTSEAFAAWVGTRRDDGTQHLVFAIGPANGWSEAARKRARLLMSLGPMTLAHALARVVLAEQVYRACTILAGHPYHCGH
jgi:23S rRNA (pseudouridine1915-N3)-methyltransferase